MAYVNIAIYFGIPVIVAIVNGSSYVFAFSLSGVGVILYFLNVFLIRWFIAKRKPHLSDEDNWEATAGTRVVPKWVSHIGLASVAFVPSGFAVALLILLGVVVHR